MLNKVEILKKNLIENYETLNKISNLKVAPVLKSNAYGHGLKETASVLDFFHPPFFCVDSLYEAYELLKTKISTPILIMGYVNPKNLVFKKLPFSYAVYDILTLKKIVHFQPHAGIHLFVDTGMQREGIPYMELEKFLKNIPSKTKIEGIMSHLAMGQKPQSALTRKQVDRFNDAINLLKSKRINPSFKHIAASSALVNFYKYKGNSLGNLARVGIALYGGLDFNFLKPTLKFSATISQIKEVKKGEKIGYDFTYEAKRDMKIGILSAGYNDGVDLRLSSTGYVLVGGIFCKIVGRVSMNITTIDITNCPKAKIGDKAIIYSPHLKDKNSIVNTAKKCNTIPYDILVHLHPSTKRIVV